MNIRERIQRIRRLRDESGKFTKAQAYYASDAPVQKQLRCGNCVYYDGTENTCDLVSEEGEPGPGLIARDGTCTLWNAQPPRITFLQWAWGRADKDGITPERIRSTAYMFTYAWLNEIPPQELREKSLIPFERVDRIVPGKIEELLTV